jgi:Flp pilus assembly protein TadB
VFPAGWQEAIQSKRKQTGGQGFPALQEREHLRVKMQSILAQKAESERRIAEAQKVQQEEERQRAAREALEKSKAKNQEWAARQLVRSFLAVETAVYACVSLVTRVGLMCWTGGIASGRMSSCMPRLWRWLYECQQSGSVEAGTCAACHIAVA